jgi:GT2 family glycosyltransferase
MSNPLVHVLVINWNGIKHLQECFDSLLASSFPNARFILLDNASTDGSVEFVRSRHGQSDLVEIVECGSNLGWSRGNNVGIERALAAGADYVMLLNNDTWTHPDAIDQLVKTAESNPAAGALAPKMLMYDDPAIINSMGLECSIIGCGWDIAVGRLDAPKWDVPRQVIGICGGACLIRSEAIRKAGLLPIDYEIYLDDLDLSLRIWNAGYEIVNCPSAVIRHKFSATMGEGARLRHKYYLNTRNRFRLIQRCFPASAIGRVLPLLVLGEARAVGRGILNGEWWKLGVHARSWWESLAYIPEALAHRRHSEYGACAFWHLIRQSPLFFPGVELPDRGWYQARPMGSRLYRPISAIAHLDTSRPKLRVFHMNCYSSLRAAEIDVFDGGRLIARLVAGEKPVETVIEQQTGHLEFRSRSIFEAEQTGEAIDIGGWLCVEPA